MLVITSESNKVPERGYVKAQYLYALTYVGITFLVLLVLNVYCSKTCQKQFFETKKAAMIEKCLLTSDEIAALDVMNSTTVSGILDQMESLKVTRLIVTDQTGNAIYDSEETAVGSYVLLPEIITALEGNDVCSWKYRDGAMDTRAATPIVYYGTIVGCVYMTEYDSTQGALIKSMLTNILRITFLLEMIVVMFSIAFSNTFSRRLNRIMTSCGSSRKATIPTGSTWAAMTS